VVGTMVEKGDGQMLDLVVEALLTYIPSRITNGVTIKGTMGPNRSKALPPQTSADNYRNGIGVGAYAAGSANGGHGLVVISTLEQNAQVSKPGTTALTFTSVTVSSSVAEKDFPVTEYGFVYSTSSSPNMSDTKIVSGSGSGSFSESLTALTENTTYYIRAYAISNGVTIYSDETEFTTPKSAPPTISKAAKAYTENQAVGTTFGIVDVSFDRDITSMEVVSVTGTDGQDYTGSYAITAGGELSVTSEAADAVNNFEVKPNRFTVVVSATDEAGNESEPTSFFAKVNNEPGDADEDGDGDGGTM
jgi:hypothetical protein